MNAEEKIDALTEFYIAMDKEMGAQAVDHLMMVLKAMILHIATRTGVSVMGLMDGLKKGYIENVEVHQDKSDEEIHQLLLDELAKQEEHSDA